MAAAAARLRLELSQPPRGGWPHWLTDGMAGIAAERAYGRGPSPRGMLRRRQAAGEAALAELLAGGTRDSELATALCAPLCHQLRARGLAGHRRATSRGRRSHCD